MKSPLQKSLTWAVLKPFQLPRCLLAPSWPQKHAQQREGKAEQASYQTFAAAARTAEVFAEAGLWQSVVVCQPRQPKLHWLAEEAPTMMFC